MQRAFCIVKLTRILALGICVLLWTACAPQKNVIDSGLKALWVIDIAPLSDAEQALTLTLQGLVAQEQTAIWIADSGINAIHLKELREQGVKIYDVDSVWEQKNLDNRIMFENVAESTTSAARFLGRY